MTRSFGDPILNLSVSDWEYCPGAQKIFEVGVEKLTLRAYKARGHFPMLLLHNGQNRFACHQTLIGWESENIASYVSPDLTGPEV